MLSAILARILRAIRHGRRIFHLTIAAIFLVLGGSGAVLALELWEDYRHTPSNGLWAFGAVAVFSVILVSFGLHSIARARSVR